MSWFNRQPKWAAQSEARILAAIQKAKGEIMAGVTDVNNAETTLHADLVAENGLIKQLLTAFANGNLTSTQAQALVDGMNADDATAKSNVAAITAALPPVPPPAA
jgi:hypothetical protein